MPKFLNIRNVEEGVAREFSAGAAVRGITQAEYLKRLLQLRREADSAVAPFIGVPGAQPESRIAWLQCLADWVVANEMLDHQA